MKNFSLQFLLLFLFKISFAQIPICNFPDEPAGDEPPGCIMCGFEYIGSNDGYTSEPSGIDFPCGTVENSLFLSFVTDNSGVFEASFTTSRCSLDAGIQLVILDENLNRVTNCFFSGSPDDPGVIYADGLTHNARYIMMADGFAGDVCDFRISVKSGVQTDGASVAAGPISLMSANISDTNQVCDQTEVCFSIDPVPGATSYNWNIGDGKATTALDSNVVCAKFSTIGSKNVKVIPFVNCQAGEGSALDFEVLQTPRSIYPTAPICPFDFPVEIDGFTFDREGIFERSFPAKICDSVVTYIIFERNQPVIDIDSVVCFENPVTIGTETFDATGQYRIFVDPGSALLCDTVINLDLTIANLAAPQIECIIDSFLNAVAFRWDNILLTEGYYIIVNGDTIKEQNFESFLYFPKEDAEIINFQIQPYNFTGCYFEPGLITCIGPGTVSTIDRKLAQRIRVVPNPSASVFRLESDLKVEKIEVLDFSGKPIFETDKNWIDLAEKPSGVYFFRVRTEEGTLVKKGVKI